jgi:predicted SprT family Zn-dependent metalloprotease
VDRDDRRVDSESVCSDETPEDGATSVVDAGETDTRGRPPGTGGDRPETATGGDARATWQDASGWPAPDSPEQLRQQAAAYARTVPVPVDLDRVDWEVSRRAKRRAGVCLHHREAGTQTIRLTWDAYEAFGWSRFAGTIRHELVHAWEFQQFDESSHGRRFRQAANRVDAPLSCPVFAEARLLLRCRSDDCDWRARRYRACPTVTRPDRRRCGDCGSRYDVHHVASGETWASEAGYERARSRVGDDW